MRNFIIGIVCIFVFTGCCTAGSGTIATGNVTELTGQLAKLEAERDELKKRLERYDSAVTAGVERLQNIGERAGRVEGDIDGIIEQFERYDRGVKQFILDHRTIQSEAGLQPPLE